MAGWCRRGFWSLVSVLGGCSVADDPHGGAERGICTTCTPRVGGETSDFGGGSECLQEPRAVTDALAEEFGVSEVVAAYSQRFENTFLWTTQGAPAFVGKQATRIRGTVQFETPDYFEATAACAERVEVPAVVEFEVLDGSLSAAVRGRLTIRRGDSTGSLEARSDLSLATGTLDLEIDAGRPHAGELVARFTSSSTGLVGTVWPDLRYFESGEDAAAYANGSRSSAGEPGTDLVGFFPAER